MKTVYTPCCLAGILSLISVLQINAQVENPVQGSVQNVRSPATIQSVKGNITPLIWKAEIEKAIVTIPLSKVEFFGVQDYVVDGLTRVRELTVSTEAQSMVRIYHIRPIEATKRLVNEAERLRSIAEGNLEELKRTDDEDRPVKIFPQTTHAHMVEYRVKDLSDIEVLYQSLEATMIEYHARSLVPQQRSGTVRSVKVGG